MLALFVTFMRHRRGCYASMQRCKNAALVGSAYADYVAQIVAARSIFAWSRAPVAKSRFSRLPCTNRTAS